MNSDESRETPPPPTPLQESLLQHHQQQPVAIAISQSTPVPNQSFRSSLPMERYVVQPLEQVKIESQEMKFQVGCSIFGHAVPCVPL